MFYFTLVLPALWEVAMASPSEEYPFIKADRAVPDGVVCAIFVAKENSQPNVQTRGDNHIVTVQGQLTVKEHFSEVIEKNIAQSVENGLNPIVFPKELLALTAALAAPTMQDREVTVKFEPSLDVDDVVVWENGRKMEESPKQGQEVWMQVQNKWKKMVNHYSYLENDILPGKKIVWIVPSADGAVPPLAPKAIFLKKTMAALEAAKKLKEHFAAVNAAPKKLEEAGKVVLELEKLERAAIAIFEEYLNETSAQYECDENLRREFVMGLEKSFALKRKSLAKLEEVAEEEEKSLKISKSVPSKTANGA